MTRFGLTLALMVLGLQGDDPAQAGEGRHRATLAAPAPDDKLVAHGLLWRCAGDQCSAPTANSRPLIVCEALAKMAGPVSSFGSGGTALNAEQLARCNGGAVMPRIAAAK